MLYQDKIEQGLKEIQELEKSFHEAQNMEILPISFFSSSIEIINRLRTKIYEIEALQLNVMQEHLKEHESEWGGTTVLADTSGRKGNDDFEKSLSLNNRFMFQRDKDGGNG